MTVKEIGVKSLMSVFSFLFFSAGVDKGTQSRGIDLRSTRKTLVVSSVKEVGE